MLERALVGVCSYFMSCVLYNIFEYIANSCEDSSVMHTRYAKLRRS